MPKFKTDLFESLTRWMINKNSNALPNLVSYHVSSEAITRSLLITNSLSKGAAKTPSLLDTHSLDLAETSQPKGQATMKAECILYWLNIRTNYITVNRDKTHTGGGGETTPLPY